MSFLTSASASVPVKYCIAFSVDSTLLAAANSRALWIFSTGLCKNDLLELSLLKQYFFPSLSVQLLEQLVITCWPLANASAHWPPNSGGDSGTRGAAARAECGAKIRMSIAQAARAAIPLEGIWGQSNL